MQSPTPPAPRPARPVHVLPGRVRIHVPALVGAPRTTVQAAARRLAHVPGVLHATACGLTGNVLVHFDPGVVAVDDLLGALALRPPAAGSPLMMPSSDRRAPAASRAAAMLRLAPDIVRLVRDLAAISTPLGAALAGIEAIRVVRALAASNARMAERAA